MPVPFSQRGDELTAITEPLAENRVSVTRRSWATKISKYGILQDKYHCSTTTDARPLCRDFLS
jgi:hypothetical protein